MIAGVVDTLCSIPRVAPPNAAADINFANGVSGALFEATGNFRDSKRLLFQEVIVRLELLGSFVAKRK